MSYKQLYDYCQTLTPKVSRKVLFPQAGAFSGCQHGISIRLSDLNPQIIRGFYLSAKNADHPVIKQHGGKHVIVLAREQNYCWRRFVSVKELMHLFDGADEETASAEDLDKVLSELLPGGQLGGNACKQTKSETKAFWMALGVLCPEPYRLQYEKEMKAGMTDAYAIALKLRIPQQIVPRLFSPGYSIVINTLTAK